MEIGLPYALTAELTHRCPLMCPYCSNPAELARRDSEMTTEEWQRVLEEAGRLGVVQIHMTGGEPLLRDDLELLVRKAREQEMFVNLITSGLGLTESRIQRLAEAGLDSVQLSIQAADPELSDAIAGRKAFSLKQRAARLIRTYGYPLHMNVVLHRQNLFQVERIIELCVSWGAERLELAHAQYYGWALLNREHLLPDRAELQTAEEAFARVRKRYEGQMELIWILPDYYEQFPKPCMGGWGKLSLAVAPDGKALPCLAAAGIRTLRLENVKEKSLEWIWRESPSFQAFRGYGWMKEPCRSCERRFIDHGGCRCQAYLLTGDAAQTDPVCQWSPHHRSLADLVASVCTAARSDSAASVTRRYGP